MPYKLHTKLGFGGRSLESYLDTIYSSKLFFYAGHTYSAVSHLKKGKRINFKYWGNTETIGIKDFSMNFTRYGITSYLKEHNDILVINLYRENILKRFISLEKMKDSGVVKVSNTGNSEKPVRSQQIKLDIPYTFEQLALFEKELADHTKMVQELPQSRVLNIRYEDLFANSDTQNKHGNEAFRFLGVEPIAAKSDHRKILSDNLADIVANYDELRDKLQGTPFAKHLGDL
ncbi:MAG: hypothetical protein ACFBSF_15920 [Leptolyngbyaceae cyanobacterium]